MGADEAGAAGHESGGISAPKPRSSAATPLCDEEEAAAEQLAVLGGRTRAVAGPDVPAVAALLDLEVEAGVRPGAAELQLPIDRPDAQDLVPAKEQLHVVVRRSRQPGPGQKRRVTQLRAFRRGQERAGHCDGAGARLVPRCIDDRERVAIADTVPELRVGEAVAVTLVHGRLRASLYVRHPLDGDRGGVW